MIWRGNTTVEAHDGGIASGRDTNIDIHIHEVHQTAKAAFPRPVARQRLHRPCSRSWSALSEAYVAAAPP